MGTDASVDDDASTLWLLLLHVPESFTCAKIRSCQVDIDGGLPVRQLLLGQGHVRRGDAGIAEDEVDSAELLSSLLEGSQHYVLLGDVTSDIEAGTSTTGSLVEQCDGLLKFVLAASGDGNVPASSRQSDCTRSSEL